jgi:hypothetical protein
MSNYNPVFNVRQRKNQLGGNSKYNGGINKFFQVGSGISAITTNYIMTNYDDYASVAMMFSGKSVSGRMWQLLQKYRRNVSILWVIHLVMAFIYGVAFIVFCVFAAGTTPQNQIKPSLIKHTTVYDSGLNAFVERDVFVSPEGGYFLYPVVLSFVGVAILAALIPIGFGAMLSYRRFFEDTPEGHMIEAEIDADDQIRLNSASSIADPDILDEDELIEFGGKYFMEIMMFGINKVQWIEFAIASSFIVWICGQLAGINDIFLLISALVLNLTACLTIGLLQEYGNTGLTIYNTFASWFEVVARGADKMVTSLVINPPKYKYATTWWPFVLGMVPFLTIWAFFYAYLGIEATGIPSSFLPWYVWTMLISVGILMMGNWLVVFIHYVMVQRHFSKKWAFMMGMKDSMSDSSGNPVPFDLNKQEANQYNGENPQLFCASSITYIVEHNYTYELWKLALKHGLYMISLWVMFAAMF